MKVTERAREYLKLTRIHTANVMISMAWLALIITGHSIVHEWKLYAMWFVYGLCMHIYGFVQNNIMDLKVDKRDERKQHFPLVSGTISQESAMGVTVIAFGIMASIVLMECARMKSYLGVIAFTVLIVSALIYNAYSKNTIYAHVGIWIAEPLIMLVPGLIYGIPFEYAIAIFFFGFMWSLYQNSIVGGLKDVGVDPQPNPIIENPDAPVFMGSFMLAAGLFLMSISNKYNYGAERELQIPTLIALIMVLIYDLYWSNESMKYAEELAEVDDKENYKLNYRISTKKAAIMEITMFSAFVLMVVPAATWYIWFPAVMVANIAWFIVMNRIMWGTLLQPKV